MSEKYKNYYVLECMHVMLYLQCLTHTREISSVPCSTYDFYYYRQMLVYNHRVCRVAFDGAGTFAAAAASTTHFCADDAQITQTSIIPTFIAHR